MYRGKTLPVNATRGCPYTCTFCSNPQMWGKKYFMRSPEDFVDELEFLNKTYGVVNFDLYDLTAIIFKDWIIAMCKELIHRNLNISYQLPSGTRSEAIDFEVASLLFQSGCKNISYAPESGSKKVLREIKKNVKIERMFTSIKHSNKAGLNIKLNMVIGFPDDTHKDIWQSFWFLTKCSWYGANDAAPAVFSPYPGSQLFDRLVAEKSISLDSDEYFFDILNTYDVMPPKVFAKHLSTLSIKIYVLLFVLIFYGSNYLFRPQRLLKTIYNVFTGAEENKIDQILRKNLIKPLFNSFNRFKSTS
ncbi:MAG: radical SAM protein [Chitinophagales bacterium]|nr:radical SAM protein [Chitinophagales bacterium]